MSAVPADVAVPAVTISEAAWRIAHWWRVTRGGVNLGFARRSVLGRVAEEGAQGAAHDHGVQPPTWLAPADEQIDKLVARMPPELREAVVLDQNSSMPMKMMCAKLGTTPAEVRRRIEGGYGWIAGALSAVQGRLMG